MADGVTVDSTPIPGQGSSPPAAGDAGSSLLANILNLDPGNTEQVKAINQGAHQLNSLASSGGFAINEAGATEYIKLCDMFLDGYKARRPSLRLLTERAQMGSSPYSQAIADHNVTVLSGDQRSLLPNLELMNDGFEQIKAAFTTARKNYREAEAANDQVFKKVNPE